MSHYLKVYGRVRPSASGNNDTALTVLDKARVKVELNGKAEKIHELHRIFTDTVTQEEVFDSAAKRMVAECTEGINGTIFAYGQTGSGKTHTMLGPAGSWSDPVEKGLIPRAIDHLFDQLERKAQQCQRFSFKVDVNFVELYNEEIYDLLSDDQAKISLRDIGVDITLIGAKSESVDNSLDLMLIVKRGWQSRRTGATAMNRDSSRSHALLIVKISTEEVNGSMRTSRTSILNLVDLAGSERQSHTKATGDRLKEATNINSSLTVLGRCIRLLSKPSTAKKFVPYRDCHLTHILKNSLGGNSKTAVIVNMHPDRSFAAETSSTLQFAETCTMIKNKVLRNEIMSGDQESSYKRAIQELRQEVEETRAKAREEFAKRLEEAEENYRKSSAECAHLKADSAELRKKYNVGLMKYSVNPETQDLPAHIKQYLEFQASQEELSLKYQTLVLELASSEKRCHELQQERDDFRERFQGALNSTLQMATPGKQRRQSSRPTRRETQYRHSPSRLAELAAEAEGDSDIKLQEAELRIESLETDLSVMRSKLEQATEERFKAEEASAMLIDSLEKKVLKITEINEDAEQEILNLQSQVKMAKATLDNLLGMINDRETTIKTLNLEKEELETKLIELQNETDHYSDSLKKLKESSTFQQKSSDESIIDLRKDLTKSRTELVEKEKNINTLQEKLQKKENELSELEYSRKAEREEFRHQEELLIDLEKQLADSSIVVAESSKLKLEITEKEKELVQLKVAVETTQQQIARKTELITLLESKLENSTAENLKLKTELDSVDEKMRDLHLIKVHLEESQKNEQQLKRRVEELKQIREDEHAGHMADVKRIREKAERELQEKEESSKRLHRMLEDERVLSEQQKTKSSKWFEEKMASLRQQFDEMTTAEVHAKEAQMKKELSSVIHQKEATHEKEVDRLQQRVIHLEKLREEDSEALRQIMTKSDKLTYIDKIRKQKADLEAEVGRLLRENDELKKSKRSSGDTTNRRVLRSHNAL